MYDIRTLDKFDASIDPSMNHTYICMYMYNNTLHTFISNSFFFTVAGRRYDIVFSFLFFNLDVRSYLTK